MNRNILIIVLYNPSIEIISKWEEYMGCNKDLDFCFVDNTNNPGYEFDGNNCKYIKLYGNKGISHAQNVGIEYAFKYNYSNIIFFDQDSVPSFNYCHLLESEFCEIEHIDSKVAILGPTLVNNETNFLYKQDYKSNSGNYYQVNTLISSGTIIAAHAIQEVGKMEDSLFIDYVDFEWCWRALSKGFTVYKSSDIVLNHKVGKRTKTIIGYPFILSAPIRYYYQYRNILWLCKRNYVPFKWKMKILIRKIVELIIVPVIHSDKKNTIKYIYKGIRDGILR